MKVENYIIHKKIGSGSFSQVYKAENQHTKQIYAIKAINITKISKKLTDSFEKEIKIMSCLKHKNIVKVYETIKTEKYTFLVMDYCNNGNLHQYIRKIKRIPEKEAREMLIQISSALFILHTKNIIHRDIKPHNILLTSDGTLKLTDFGFVTSYNTEESLMDTLCGSPLYMAPEVLKFTKYDSKIDLWSIGAVFFEMLTGKPPFMANNHIELLKKIETTDFVIPEDLALSDLCIDLLKSLIVVNPKYRINYSAYFKHDFFAGHDFEIHVSKESNFEKIYLYTDYSFKNCMEIFSLAERSDLIESFSVTIYGLKTLEHLITICNDYIKDNCSINDEQKNKLNVDRMLNIFSKYLKKSEENFSFINKDVVIPAPEYFIYHEALKMIKEACSNEILDNLEHAKNLYVWSSRLLKTINIETPRDQNIIDSFVQGINKRLYYIDN